MMTWSTVRKWKSGIAIALMVIAYVLLESGPEGSARWKAGSLIGLGLGIAYVAEEIFWIAKRQGRPCSHCGEKVRLKAFRLTANCPHCDEALD